MRITKALLQARIDTINTLLYDSIETYDTTNKNGRYIPLVGRYQLSCGYGGYSVERLTGTGWGVSHACGTYGHMPARELELSLSGFIDGIRTVNEMKKC